MMSTQCSKHVEEYNKLIIKQEFVYEVGQLLSLKFKVLPRTMDGVRCTVSCVCNVTTSFLRDLV